MSQPMQVQVTVQAGGVAGFGKRVVDAAPIQAPSPLGDPERGVATGVEVRWPTSGTHPRRRR